MAQNNNIEAVTTPEEIGKLAEVAVEIWNEYFQFLLSQEQIDYMLDKFLSKDVLIEQQEDGYEYYFLKDKDEEILGFFVIHPEEDRLFLSKIYLYKDQRGKGLSNEMFDFIENRAKELGLDKVYLTVNKHNDLPIAVYKNRSFETIDSVVTDIGQGFVMDDFIMQKDLSN